MRAATTMRDRNPLTRAGRAALRTSILDRSRNDGAMLAIAAAVGIGTGLLAVLLVTLIVLVKGFVWGPSPVRWQVIAVPVLGGFVVGGLRVLSGSQSHDSGVTATMRAIAIHAGHIPVLRTLVKGLGTVVSIGTGAAGGREGPMVLLGSMVGSTCGRWLALDEERSRSLIAAGAASGIAASFNAPIGGMLFAMEVIIGGFKVRSLQVVVIAAVLSSVISRQLLGGELIYAVERDYVLEDPRELLLYAALGVLAVLVARTSMATEEAMKRRFTSSPLPDWTQPAIGGLMVGVLALGLPEVLGTGHDNPPLPLLSPAVGTDPVRSFIEGGPGTGLAAAGFLLVLMVGKILAANSSIASGHPVGELAPTLFIGASLGGALGHVATVVLPGTGIEPGAYALVGMAAAFGASGKAPLTGILIVFELTSDYGLVLPLMLATGLATFLADRLWEGSIYTRQLRRDGVVYAEPDDIDVMQTVSVGEVMTTDPDTVTADLPVVDLAERFVATGHHGYPVVDAHGRLAGIVTRSDVDARLGDADPGDLTVGDIATTTVSTVTPDDPVFRAVRRMAALNVGRIPVVAADDRGKLVGLIRRSDLVQAYQRAITRSMGVQQRKDRSRLRELADTRFAEVVVAPASLADGRQIQHIEWPERTLVTGIRRGGESLTPSGTTRLHAGDEVVFLTGSESIEDVRVILADPATVPEETA